MQFDLPNELSPAMRDLVCIHLAARDQRIRRKATAAALRVAADLLGDPEIGPVSIGNSDEVVGDARRDLPQDFRLVFEAFDQVTEVVIRNEALVAQQHQGGDLHDHIGCRPAIIHQYGLSVMVSALPSIARSGEAGQ